MLKRVEFGFVSSALLTFFIIFFILFGQARLLTHIPPAPPPQLPLQFGLPCELSVFYFSFFLAFFWLLCCRFSVDKYMLHFFTVIAEPHVVLAFLLAGLCFFLCIFLVKRRLQLFLSKCIRCPLIVCVVFSN